MDWGVRGVCWAVKRFDRSVRGLDSGVVRQRIYERAVEEWELGDRAVKRLDWGVRGMDRAV